jgi:uncharacterized protein YegP (UPF0339 family)
MNRAKFVLWKSHSDWQWYWRLVSSNGETVAQSEGYTTKAAALKGIKAVRRIALFARLDVKSDE